MMKKIVFFVMIFVIYFQCPMKRVKDVARENRYGIFEGRVGNKYRVIDEYHKHARGAWQKEMVKKGIGKFD